jgi:CelD/BcsL family acetyltransferase involved in cellulose biosynthesis
MPEGCDDSVEAASACPVLRLPDSTAALAEVYPARKRRALRLARNRAARRGGIDIVAARDPAAALGMLATLIRLHGARWQAQGGAGVLADPRVRDFHRRSVQRSSRAGWLRLLELRIAGAVAAVYYGFQHRGCAYGYLTGFDPAYDYESPGVILLAAAMERAIRDGAREFHFLRGREAYKYGWGAEDRWNRRRVFRRRESYARAS